MEGVGRSSYPMKLGPEYGPTGLACLLCPIIINITIIILLLINIIIISIYSPEEATNCLTACGRP